MFKKVIDARKVLVYTKNAPKTAKNNSKKTTKKTHKMKTKLYTTKVGNLSLSVPACVINETIENGKENWENNVENLEKVDWDDLPPSALKLELKTRNIALNVKEITLKGDELEQKEIAKENKTNIYYASKNYILWIACMDIVEKLGKDREMAETVELEILHGIKNEPLIAPSEKLFVSEVNENKPIPRYDGDKMGEKVEKGTKVERILVTKAEISSQKGKMEKIVLPKKEKVEKVKAEKTVSPVKELSPAKEKRKTELACLISGDGFDLSSL